MSSQRGNAWAMAKEVEELKKTLSGDPTKKELAGPSKPAEQSIELSVPAREEGMIPTPNTTMSMILGPETEDEKYGKEAREKMAQDMKEKLDKRPKWRKKYVKKKQTRTPDQPPPEPEEQTMKHLSALPKPLFADAQGGIRSRNEITNQPPFTGIQGEARNRSGSTSQPLFTGIQGAFRSRSESTKSRAGSIAVTDPDYAPTPPQKDTVPNLPLGPTTSTSASTRDYISRVTSHDTGRYPNPLNLEPPYPTFPFNATHLSTATYATNESQYAQPAPTPVQGMILSTQFLTPTRSGSYGTVGNPQLVERPHIASYSGSIDVTSPLPPAAPTVITPPGQRYMTIPSPVLPEKRPVLGAPTISDFGLASQIDSHVGGAGRRHAARRSESAPALRSPAVDQSAVMLAAVEGLHSHIEAVETRLGARLEQVAARVEEVASAVALLGVGAGAGVGGGVGGRRERRPMQASLSAMPPHVPYGISAVPSGRVVSDGEAGLVSWYEKVRE